VEQWEGAIPHAGHRPSTSVLNSLQDSSYKKYNPVKLEKIQGNGNAFSAFNSFLKTTLKRHNKSIAPGAKD